MGAYTHAAPALTYAVPHVNPVVYTLGLPAAGCQNSEGAFVPRAQGSYFGYVPVAAAAAPVEAAPAVEAERKKREAEAEPTALAEAEAEADPEADPWLYYSGVYGGHLGYGGYSHYRPLTYSYAPYTYSHVYNHYGLGHYGLGYYGRRKREATAEPEATADPEADPWLLYGGWTWTWTWLWLCLCPLHIRKLPPPSDIFLWRLQKQPRICCPLCRKIN